MGVLNIDNPAQHLLDILEKDKLEKVAGLSGRRYCKSIAMDFVE